MRRLQIIELPVAKMVWNGPRNYNPFVVTKEVDMAYFSR